MTDSAATLTPPAFSRHALNRYRERLLPHALTRDEVLEHLHLRIERCGHIQQHPPEWFGQEGCNVVPAASWLILGFDVAFPLSESDVAITCLVRGDTSNLRRFNPPRGKNRGRKRRRAA